MSAFYNPAIALRKQRNVEIFNETMEISKRGWYVAPSGTKVELPSVGDVCENSCFYDCPPSAEQKPAVQDTVIDAVNEDCVKVARGLVEEGFRPILLNMANRHTPGGGVLEGSRAQEESLFRQSNLCLSLYQYHGYLSSVIGVPRKPESYPMDRKMGGIYSGRVTFFRTGARDGDCLVERPFECAVVSVAALAYPKLTPEGRLDDWGVRVTKSKIRTMLRIGLVHGHDAIVLGAWGCGAFHNPPDHMAELFHQVLEEPEFCRKYRRVRFAIIEDHNSRRSNFAPFANEFNM